MLTVLWGIAFLIGVGAIVWGAEAFTENLGAASAQLGVSAFALALLLAGAEPEELATVVAASLGDAPGIAVGDVIGANVAISLVALGTGAVVATLPFRAAVMRYALLGLPLGAIAAWIAWDGRVGRSAGALLVALYGAYVALIWIAERKPPSLGEVDELADAAETLPGRVGVALLMVLVGVAAMAGGATLLVEAVRQVTEVEATQTMLGLTIVGFATAFELVVLAWSAARRGVSEAAVAGVVGSFAYNATMTLGAGALARPLQIQDAPSLHLPWIAMVAALGLVTLLAARRGALGRREGLVLLAAYPLFIVLVLTVQPG